MKQEILELIAASILVCFVIGLLVIVFNLTGLADNAPPSSSGDLPSPEWTDADVILLERGEAPAISRAGLNSHPSFDETLASVKAGLPAHTVELVGRAIWAEADIVPEEYKRAAVAWCALNRVDAWGLTLDKVLVPSMFHGMSNAHGPVPERHLETARDVLARWLLEKSGYIDVGRSLPERFLYFWGDGLENYFTTAYGCGEVWNWEGCE